MERKDSWPAWRNRSLGEFTRALPAALKDARASASAALASGSSAPPPFITNFQFIQPQCGNF